MSSAATASIASSVLDTNGIIQSDHFSLEHLEQHGRQLADELKIVPRKSSSLNFLSKVKQNGQALRVAHRQIADAVRAGEATEADAEWLLDNFNIVEDQLREIKEDLPRGFYNELPLSWPMTSRGFTVYRWS